MKILSWTCPESELSGGDLHVVVHLGREIMDTVEVGERIKMMLEYDNGSTKYLGMGEVVSIKLTRVRDMDPVDSARAKRGFRGPHQILETFKILYPYHRSTPDQIITVITVKKLDYSLSALNRLVKKKQKKQ